MIEKIKIPTKDGFLLDTVFNSVGEATKVVIFAHGMIVDKDDEGVFVKAEEQLVSSGISTIRFDFRAHGQSTGKPIKDMTIQGEIEDLNTIVRYLKQFNFSNIGIAGASFGGGIVSLYVGSKPKDFYAVLLINPVLDYEKAFLKPTTPWAKEYFHNLFERLYQVGYIEIGSGKFKMGKTPFEEMKKFCPIKELSNYKGPLMVIHGSKDSKIDFMDNKMALESIGRKITEVSGAEHGFHEALFENEVSENIAKFFNNPK